MSLPARYDPLIEALRLLPFDLPVGDPQQSPPPQALLSAVRLVLEAYLSKNPTYGDSWARRGDVGAFHNVARKFDRMEQSVVVAREVPRVDDVADLAVYAVLFLAWYVHVSPDSVREWRMREVVPLLSEGV